MAYFWPNLCLLALISRSGFLPKLAVDKTKKSFLYETSTHSPFIVADPYHVQICFLLLYSSRNSNVKREIVFINHLFDESDHVSLLWIGSSQNICGPLNLSKAMKLNVCGREIMGETRCKNLSRCLHSKSASVQMMSTGSKHTSVILKADILWET